MSQCWDSGGLLHGIHFDLFARFWSVGLALLTRARHAGRVVLDEYSNEVS